MKDILKFKAQLNQLFGKKYDRGMFYFMNNYTSQAIMDQFYIFRDRMTNTN